MKIVHNRYGLLSQFDGDEWVAKCLAPCEPIRLPASTISILLISNSSSIILQKSYNNARTSLLELSLIFGLFSTLVQLEQQQKKCQTYQEATGLLLLLLLTCLLRTLSWLVSPTVHTTQHSRWTHTHTLKWVSATVLLSHQIYDLTNMKSQLSVKQVDVCVWGMTHDTAVVSNENYIFWYICHSLLKVQMLIWSREAFFLSRPCVSSGRPYVLVVMFF